jgi:hypothetical protein
MCAEAPRRDPLIDLENIEERKYAGIGLDNLIVYTVSRLADMGVDLSFENIAVAAYRLFPAKFSLIGYPEYPDAKRVHDSLFHCIYKTKGWLGGKTKLGFSLTDKSEKIIAETEALLAGAPSARKPAPSQTRRDEKLMAEVRSSSAYTKFATGRADSISFAEICFMLHGTLDTSPTILKANYDAFMRIAQVVGQEDVIRFLSWVKGEARFAKLMVLPKGGRGR